jgi:hypothetical protein
MYIEKHNEPGSYRTGAIVGLTVAQINEILGFKPNVFDDPDKVKYSWGFKADGEVCGIWDYKSYNTTPTYFSTYGPDWVFEKLFGKYYNS